MLVSAESWGSRGAALVMEPEGEILCPGLPETACRPEKQTEGNCRTVTGFQGKKAFSEIKKAPALPAGDQWFETVWADYRQNRQL